jgi:hypothetical protein
MLSQKKAMAQYGAGGEGDRKSKTAMPKGGMRGNGFSQ